MPSSTTISVVRVHPEAYVGWKRKTNNRIIIRRYSLVSYRNIGKFIRELCRSCVLYEYTLNADFDGDVLNLIGIMTDELVYAFRKFDPVTRMIISRDSGLLNDYFTITKGQLIDLYYFCTI